MKGAISAVAGLQLLCTVVVCPLLGPCRGGHVEPEGQFIDTGAKLDVGDAGDAADTTRDATDSQNDASDGSADGDTSGE